MNSADFNNLIKQNLLIKTMANERINTFICLAFLAAGLVLLAFGKLIGFIFLGFSISFIGKVKLKDREIRHFGRKALVFATIFLIFLFVLEVYIRNPYMTLDNRNAMVLQSFLNEFTMFGLFFSGFLLMRLGSLTGVVDKIDLVLK